MSGELVGHCPHCQSLEVLAYGGYCSTDCALTAPVTAEKPGAVLPQSRLLALVRELRDENTRLKAAKGRRREGGK